MEGRRCKSVWMSPSQGDRQWTRRAVVAAGASVAVSTLVASSSLELSRRGYTGPDFGSPLTIRGPFKSYYAPPSPFSAYTGAWGLHIPAADNLEFATSMTLYPDVFPKGTRFDWDVTPDPDWDGVNGYLAVSYGNFDDSPGDITPRQANAIANLTVDARWTYDGDDSSGLLCEMWLGAAAAVSGGFTKTHEVAYFPRLSPEAASWVDRFPDVGTGSFTDSNDVVWNVVEALSGDGVLPYYVAYRPSYLDFVGPFLFHDYIDFLISSGAIAGTEWFNGVAFGVEPRSGEASLTLDKLDVTYIGTP